MFHDRLFSIETVSLALACVLALHAPVEMRLADDYQKQHHEEPSEPARPAALVLARPQGHQCFHMEREHCPPPAAALRCRKVDERSVLCCDVDSVRLREGLAHTFKGQNVSYLHISNATMEELDVGQGTFRRLTHMAVTDGHIGKISGQFPKLSSLTCLNISNNNLTSEKLVGWSRPFAYIVNLTVLDVSANNLTEFPISLVHITRKIAIDLSGNNYTLCKEYLKAMEGNNSQLITFLNDNKTFCVLSLTFNWFNESQFVAIEHVRIQKELNASCRLIQPTSNCTCTHERYDVVNREVITTVSVDCTNLHLKELPTNLPSNTIMLNVSYNNISSLGAVADDPSYERVRRLYIDYNNVQSLMELEGTRFIDNFMFFSIQANKLKTIHTYILSNTFDYSNQRLFFISKNQIHCDCNTEKVLKVWLLENSKNIPDYSELMCEDGKPVIDLVENKVCQQQRNWTDYIYYIIGAEVSVLIILISKVSYDYWIFKTAGYLPWPANKMPRLPCDWLCE